MKANAAAMPSHIAARLFAARISAISWRGSSSCLRMYVRTFSRIRPSSVR